MIKEYTEEQLRRVAEWLGLTWNPKRGGGWMRGQDNIYLWGLVVRNHYIKEWLLSHAGRCAIEDKFLHEDGYYSCHYREHRNRYYVVFDDGNEMYENIAEGPTPAHAWLDAAVKSADCWGGEWAPSDPIT